MKNNKADEEKQLNEKQADEKQEENKIFIPSTKELKDDLNDIFILSKIKHLENNLNANEEKIKENLIELTDFQEEKRDSFQIDQSGKIDAKFQAQKVKAGIPVEKTPITYFNQYGDEFLCTGLLYDKNNESYIMFKANNQIKVRHASEATRIIYPNGQFQLGYVFHEFILDSFSMRISEGKTINEKMINLCKYITSSYEIVEKNTFAKRFSDMSKGEKTLVILSMFGGIGIGIILCIIFGI